MIGLGWVILKQAQEALRAGQLEEVQQFLVQPQVQGHRRALEILQQLVRAYVERGEKHLRNDDLAKAWTDLLKAEQIGITENFLIQFRQKLNRLGLAEVRALLNASEPARALEAINLLRTRAANPPELDALESGAKDWVAANEYMDRGDFAQAIQILERISQLFPGQARVLEQACKTARKKSQEFDPLLMLLNQAAQNERWPEVVSLSEKLLALAPQHGEVRRMRSRAWKALEPSTVMMQRPKALPPPLVGEKKLARFNLWIDGIGGFLLLLDNCVTIGQGGPDSSVDIALVADVSRTHAQITRDTEGYVLEAMRPVKINNVPVDKKLLKPGDRLTLGSSCQMVFRQDVPVSASARLDLVSGHRFAQSVDAVLLMAETLVLGPAEPAHIIIPTLKEQMILFRNKGELGIRASEEVFINGHLVTGRGTLEPGCHVSSSSCSLTLEAASTIKLGTSRHSR